MRRRCRRAIARRVWRTATTLRPCAGASLFGPVCAAAVRLLGPLRGYVDAISRARIEGWAQNMAMSPEAPVCLDICAGGRLIGQMLANRFREDLRRAGFGSGRHAFSFAPPAGFKIGAATVEVRRSLDGGRLPGVSCARAA